MREIKFEYGFESVNGTVKKVYHLHEIPNIQQKCDVWDVLPVKYVRQFTEETDKNGVDIYEDDVVIHFVESEFLEREDWEIVKAAVVSIKGQWCVGASQYPLYAFPNSVIGNIHENPELL
jgi:hypothetical protein